jgi:hypothetical protein
MSKSLYAERGVSAQKEEVHAATRHLDQGLYPNAFCKIYPDMLAGDADMHDPEFHAGLPLGDIHGIADCVDRFFDIGYDAAEHPDAFYFTHTEDFHFTVCVFAACEAAYFGRSDIECNDYIMRLSH